jgi:small-conductance mechanosensitive channel
MLKFIDNPYLIEEIITIITLVTYFISKALTVKIVRRFAKSNEVLEHRANLVIKYINLLIGMLSSYLLIIIAWGVKKEQILLFISSVFAVVGVASFAQWSILSNVTAGIVFFFSYPFKIGDKIRIHDKDFPIEAEIEDIKAFYILLKSNEGELITFPNNLLMQKGISIVNEPIERSEFTD